MQSRISRRQGRIGTGAVLALGHALRVAARPDGIAMPSPLPLVELRRYRTRPGRRDELIALFEREFVESQEAVGMEIIGTFREPGRPDRFTWIRGFADMDARGRGLNDFYLGPVWQAHRSEANATLDDNDDVLLLREARSGAGFAVNATPRAAPDAKRRPHGLIAAIICPLKDADDSGFVEAFDATWRPRLKAARIPVLASFVRERAANNFPRLPVREAEEVFVWFSAFPDAATYDRAVPLLTDGGLNDRLGRPPEVLRLEPTIRSRLHD